MRCPKCGHELGEGLLPARCPACGESLAGEVRRGGAHLSGAYAAQRRGPAERNLASRMSAGRAAASRASVEGLSGVGKGRRETSRIVKAVVRIILGFALVAAFCGIVYVVLYQTEVIGGRSVPDLVGWRAGRAVDELTDDGFLAATKEVATTEQPAGMVVSSLPPAGSRVEPGSTVTLEVATAPEGGQ